MDNEFKLQNTREKLISLAKFFGFILVVLSIGYFLNHIVSGNSKSVNDEVSKKLWQDQEQEQKPFKGSYPNPVKAGEPFPVNFTITNNSDIPMVAAMINFEDTGMISKVIPEPNWSYEEDFWGKLQGIKMENLFIEKGESLESKLTFQIDVPGTYQFKLHPSIKVGQWEELGTYVVSVIVQDTPKAQQMRNKKEVLAKINEIDEKINDLKWDIKLAEDFIASTKDNINNTKELIKNAENREDIESYNRDIVNWSKEIQEKRKLIDKNQSEIKALLQEKQILLREIQASE
ncbi:hypothetical protein [Desulfofundulus thermosubterraneus]|uniref:Uncharacterized protein n=1 Tax=Desulfofundulus thermosubterraneus DSM 16057 TaxID=1121432 RepID=A0A1M6J9J5_9FIRM|nr:hypothetical protein [Desulfofundulus thermosubterraneus]SHJ43324.1 hypothetical protein SAMN02745219_02543 [Desulfofundulus thermosubterraneus DSM 16057]